LNFASAIRLSRSASIAARTASRAASKLPVVLTHSPPVHRTFQPLILPELYAGWRVCALSSPVPPVGATDTAAPPFPIYRHAARCPVVDHPGRMSRTTGRAGRRDCEREGVGTDDDTNRDGAAGPDRRRRDRGGAQPGGRMVLGRGEPDRRVPRRRLRTQLSPGR